MGELTNAEPIVFDADAADDLAARLRATATLLRSQVPHRNNLAGAARVDWQGVYAERFGARMQVCATDAGRLAEALDDAAGKVDELARLAKEEQDRRTAARAWKVEHDAWQREQDDRNLFEQGWDLVAGDDEPKPPNLTPRGEPRIPIAAPQQASRDQA